MSEPIQNRVELKTSTLVYVSMIAGVGLAQIEVSKWVRVGVAALEKLSEKFFTVVQFVLTLGGSMTAFQLTMCLIALTLGVLFLIYLMQRSLR